jgi:hypothetical protein
MFEIKKKEKNSSVLIEYLPCHHPVAGSTYASTVRSICFLLLPAVRPSFPFGTFLVEQTFCKKNCRGAAAHHRICGAFAF